MQTPPQSSRSRRLAAIGVLIIVVGIAVAYYETVGSSQSSAGQISSLSSEASSLSQVVASQSSQIASLQSQLSSTGHSSTITVTSTSVSTTTKTTTATTSTTVTSTKTTTITSTTVFTTVLSVGEPDVASLSGTLDIPGGNGSGTLTLTIANTGNDPIIGVNVTVPTGADPTSDLCSSKCTMQISYNGNPISTSNPLPIQNNVIGSLTTTQGVSGDSYTITVTITYADGTTPPGLSITLPAAS